jgi:hypothetical protein
MMLKFTLIDADWRLVASNHFTLVLLFIYFNILKIAVKDKIIKKNY